MISKYEDAWYHRSRVFDMMVIAKTQNEINDDINALSISVFDLWEKLTNEEQQQLTARKMSPMDSGSNLWRLEE